MTEADLVMRSTMSDEVERPLIDSHVFNTAAESDVVRIRQSTRWTHASTYPCTTHFTYSSNIIMLQNTRQSCLCRCWFILYSTCWLPYAGNYVKLYKTHNTASVRDCHFFSNRVINVWNSLPDTVVSSATVTGLKLKLLIGLMLSL